MSLQLTNAHNMKDYLLLFRGGDTERSRFSPEEMQAQMEVWQQWIAGIAQNNQFGGGHPLTPEGKVLHGGTRKLTDGPFMEGKEILGGYIIVKAKDLEEAARLAEGCPILNAESGTVEIREIGAMSAV